MLQATVDTAGTVIGAKQMGVACAHHYLPAIVGLAGPGRLRDREGRGSCRSSWSPRMENPRTACVPAMVQPYRPYRLLEKVPIRYDPK